MAKKLFVLIKDSGDGSYHTVYTFNEEWIKATEEKDQNNEIDYEDYHPGFDGDGFHYTTLIVPDECTLESLGIHTDVAERYS